MTEENYFNYFTEVEEYFVLKRERSLLVSPLDWCLIEVWKDSGVPLHIVMRGIDRSFEGAGKRRKKKPATLFYCHPAVMEVFEEYSQGRTGSHEEEAEPSSERVMERGQVADLVQQLVQSLEHREGEPYRRASNRLQELALELAKDGELRLEEIDKTLLGIGSMLAQGLLESMSGESRKLLKKEVRKSLKIYKKRLSPEMYAKMEATYLERRVREEHDLPEFSLLEMQR